MIGRHQLPVSSPVSTRGILRGVKALIRPNADDLLQVSAELCERHAAVDAVLTDSGTSALSLALSLLAGRGRTVAMPAYACIDLASAAQVAGVRVRLYDVDPRTLSPDLASLEAALHEGAIAVVAVHLFGYPADTRLVRALAQRFGVPLIEDACQAAGATLDGGPAGQHGDATVLSFGRGKGMTGGGGGALLLGTKLARHAQALRTGLRPAVKGVGELMMVAGQWALGRPSLFAIPSALPAFRLGEMVYRPGRAPAALSAATAAMLRGALSTDADEIATRRANARLLQQELLDRRSVRPVAPVPGAAPAYLRFAYLDAGGSTVHRKLGMSRGFPVTLDEHPEMRRLMDRHSRMPGAATLRDQLRTLPTHSHMQRQDIVALAHWLDQIAPSSSLSSRATSPRAPLSTSNASA